MSELRHAIVMSVDRLRAEFSPLTWEDARSQVKALVQRGLLDADIDADVPFRTPDATAGADQSAEPTPLAERSSNSAPHPAPDASALIWAYAARQFDRRRL